MYKQKWFGFTGRKDAFANIYEPYYKVVFTSAEKILV